MIRIGTRGSKLALYQAEEVKKKLEEYYKNEDFEIVVIKTQGDTDQKSSLTEIGGIGVFCNAIETSLLNDEIDIAVHSLKDVPTRINNNTCIAATLKRGDVRDVVIFKDESTNILNSKIIATGSRRRMSQISQINEKIEFVDIRGNINTRISKLKENVDGIVVAKTALDRLGIYSNYEKRCIVFDENNFICSPSQAIIGIQTTNKLKKFVSVIKDENSYKSAMIERAFLFEFGVGCSFPIGAYYDGVYLKVFVNVNNKTYKDSVKIDNKNEASVLAIKVKEFLYGK